MENGGELTRELRLNMKEKDEYLVLSDFFLLKT